MLCVHIISFRYIGITGDIVSVSRPLRSFASSLTHCSLAFVRLVQNLSTSLPILMRPPHKLCNAPCANASPEIFPERGIPIQFASDQRKPMPRVYFDRPPSTVATIPIT